MREVVELVIRAVKTVNNLRERDGDSQVLLIIPIVVIEVGTYTGILPEPKFKVEWK